MIAQLLKTCGLNSSEQLVILYLVEHGASLASMIAKRNKMKRPTVYAALDSLIDEGLVTKEHTQKAIYFNTIGVEFISELLIEKAKRNFTKVKDAAQSLESELIKLSTFRTENMGGFQVTTAESLESIYQWLIESFGKNETIRTIFNSEESLSDPATRKSVKHFIENTNEHKSNIRELVVSGEKVNWYKNIIRNPNHQLKEIPANTEIFSDMIIANGIVTILHYTDNNQFGIRIQHPSFYLSMKTIFEMLWKTN